MEEIIHFCSNPLFEIMGAITTILMFISFVYGIACWFFCITPIAFRFGIGLQKREVAIFGNDKAFGELKECLTDARIFKEKNIIHIRDNNIDKAKDKTFFLVDWSSLDNNIGMIFNVRKNHQTPVIIYAKPGSIPQDIMSDIANRTNTIVVNFKGRLLNDILTALVTTNYNKN